jgi:hypothetical protein
MSASDTIEAQGHLIDSGLLSALFDKIIEFKGTYEILTFDIGRTNDDPSRIQMRITTPDRAAAERDSRRPETGHRPITPLPPRRNGRSPSRPQPRRARRPRR